MEHKPHINEYKKGEVESVKTLFNEYPVVALVNLENLPSAAMQGIKHKLKNLMILKVTKKRFIKIALDQLKEKKNIDKLKENVVGMPALIFTKENPFKIYRMIDKNKTNAAAKPGQIAPEDLTIDAGPTPFIPGPMIGELGQLGIKTEVKEGKINIKEPKVLVKKGEVVNEKASALLAKLGVEPMKIGINVLLTYDNGEIIPKDILSITEEDYLNWLKQASSESMNLAVYIGYATKETINILIKKAYIQADSLSSKIKIPEEKPVEEKTEDKKEEIKLEKPQENKVEVKETLKAEEPKTEIKEVKEAVKKEERIEIKEEPKKEESKPIVEIKPKIKENPLPETKKQIKEEKEVKIVAETKPHIPASSELKNEQPLKTDNQSDVEVAQKVLKDLQDKKSQEKTKKKIDEDMKKAEENLKNIMKKI